jgi:hypothetical protein
MEFALPRVDNEGGRVEQTSGQMVKKVWPCEQARGGRNVYLPLEFT